MKLEHKAGPDIIYELAVRLYPSPLESFREAISNSLDEGTSKVDLQVSLNEIILEDWGEGIEDVDRFTMFGQYSKAALGGETIGQKGLGKLSLLRLGDSVEFRTNNGEIGHKIIMTPKDFDVETKSKDRFLAHKGTRVVIPKPKEVPQIEALSKYLEKIFALRIARGTELFLNGSKLKSRLEPKEEFVCRLKGGVDVGGNLKADKRSHGMVDLYIRHVFVKSILVDPERDFTGWINCNALTPVTNRNDVIEDETYLDLYDHLREHVAKKFPKREEQVGKDEVNLGNELSKLLKSYLKDMKLLPQGMLPIGKGNENSEDAQSPPKQPEKEEKKKEEEKKEEDVPEYVKLHSHPKTDKPIKRMTKTDFGINWIYQNAGNDKEPLFFIAPNMLIQNRTNDLYKFALKNKSSLGPKWLRLLPYLSRVAVSINPASGKLTNPEERNLAVDQATRYFLKHYREI